VQNLYGELKQVAIILLVVCFCFTLFCALLGILVSHKIAGPLEAFKRTFIEVRNGQTNSRINLRSGDEFKDVAREFNLLMDQLQKGR